MHKHKSPINLSTIANNRIKILFDTALLNAEDLDYSAHCISEMRKISSHHRIKLDKIMKESFCRKCNNLLLPGKTAKVRVLKKGNEIVYKCTICGTEKHIIRGIMH